MITKLPTIHCPLTAALSAEHAALPQINGDRKLKPARVKYLAERLEEGLFYSPEWAVVYCKGIKYRLNGKHSANLLASLNGHFPTDLTVTIKQFNCDTPLDMATLFEQFDTQASVRSRNECLNVHKSLHEGLSDLSPTSLSVAVAGIAWFFRETGEKVFSLSDQQQLVHDHVDFIRFAAQFSGTRRLKRPGVIAAMFTTYSLDPEDAQTFWTLVANESHEDSTNGSRVLGRFLELTTFNPIETATRRKWDTRAFYVKSIHGWNAYRGGHSTDLKYHPNSPLPKAK